MKKTLLAFLLAVLTIFGQTVSAGAQISVSDFSYEEFTPVSGRVIVTFDLKVSQTSDGVIGIAASNVTPQAYSDYAVCVRIREGGYFDAVNGPSSWGYDNKIPYITGQTYRVILDCDTNEDTYSAFIEENNIRKTVAEGYAFRRSADDLAKITARNGGNYQGGLYEISNIEFTKGEEKTESFSLPNFYAENMVLQRGRDHVIFGRSNAEYVDVSLTDGTVESKTRAVPENGEFKAYLSELPASLEPYKLTVSSKDKTEVIENVFIGDVFILAGQSNMAQNYEFQTSQQLGGGVSTSNLPIRVSDNRIKHFTMERSAASDETFDVPCKTEPWQPLTEDNNKTLSYIGQFFAKERLNAEPEVPVGLISAAWGGTKINRWMRKSDENRTLNYEPTNGDIFNNHIAPLVGMPFKAMLWYQGESDASNPVMYSEAFPKLIEDYRELWNEDFPFLFVQLARYSKENYAPQRQAQMKALELSNTGMAVILDTDKETSGNIHPLGKETVAQRLSLLADDIVYGKDVVSSGPIFESAQINGDEITVHFKSETIGRGLAIQNTYNNTGDALCEFEIASENGEFVPAKAVIQEDNTVKVTSESVKNPAFVRYAYSAVPENPNLFNIDGLPAAPFNTDTRIVSSDSFMTRGFENEISILQHVSFTAIPMKENIDAVIGFTSLENNITAWSNAGAVIRFYTNGYVEYYDKTGYKTSTFSYSAGEDYEIEVYFDFSDSTYTVVLDGRLLCDKAQFRVGSLEMKNAGRLLVRGGDKQPAGQLYVKNYAIDIPEKVTVYESSNLIVTAGAPYDVYGASYDGQSLLKAAKAKKGSGVTAMQLPDGEAIKIFLWSEDMCPVLDLKKNK